jgi:glutamyl/glutaminyl-tRNA synthetase
MAPSPTGNLHIGTARTALFNFLFARNKKGKFLLRMEDTDEKRSTLEHEKNIIDNLKWLDINWDGEIERQMKRLKIYKEYSLKLLKEGKAYYCFCSPKELEQERKK